MTCQACYNGPAIAVMDKEQTVSYTTYTLLVTIAHDAGAAPSTELLETMVQRGLEEGVREMAGVDSATVSAVEGEHLGTVRLGRNLEDVQRRIKVARELHAHIRA